MKAPSRESRYHTDDLENRTLTDYAKRFARLNTDRSRPRSATISNQAPHKPFLLLSIIDLFEQGEMSSNLISLTPDLRDLFARYWARIMPPDVPGDLTFPFFHLRSEGFWHFSPKSGKEGELDSRLKVRDNADGAYLDTALYELLRLREPRELLRSVLIETYFVPEARDALISQGTVNNEAYRYSEKLLKQNTEQAVREALKLEETYRPVREQGFRRAVVTAYLHCCALCEIRVQTIYGHTVVEAAHIKPWSVSHDDRPANGMALCRTCHWTFDEGLVRISPSYMIFTSAQLEGANNLPGYLTNLKGRRIILPSVEAYWPDSNSLKWHQKEIFRH